MNVSNWADTKTSGRTFETKFDKLQNQSMRLSLLSLLFLPLFLTAQTNAEFYNDFKEVKLLLASDKDLEDIPLLESLWERAPENGNVAYLLGSTYVKNERKVKKAIKILEFAKTMYSADYDKHSVYEKNSSEYSFYYLIIGYAMTNKCVKTIETLNQFYKIFSYEDEWYLVEGQRWHRICGTTKFKDEKGQLLADADSVENIENKEPEELIIDTIVKEAAYLPRFPNTTASPERRYRARLRPITNPESHGIQTKTQDYTTTNSLYGVQVGAFIEPKFIRDFENLKNVEVYLDENGVFRYVVGRLIYPTQAEKLLEYVKEVGYADAFIVDINSGLQFKEEVVTINNQPIKMDIRGKVDYRVQIGAFKEEIPDEMVKNYLTIDRIRENIEGDLTILTVGSYASYDIAKVYCEQIKENGIPDAFVVAYNYTKKIPIQEANAFLDRKSAANQSAEETEESQSKSSSKKKKRKKNRKKKKK